MEDLGAIPMPSSGAPASAGQLKQIRGVRRRAVMSKSMGRTLRERLASGDMSSSEASAWIRLLQARVSAQRKWERSRREQGPRVRVSVGASALARARRELERSSRLIEAGGVR